MGMSTGGGGRGAPLSEINVTPFVDVMLVLLIIFMVTAPMLTTGVDVDLPNADAPSLETDEEKPLIFIALAPEDQRVEGGPVAEIYFFEEEVTLSQLEQRLRTDERVVEQQVVYVQGDENVPYGEVVKVLALIREVGIENMSLVTEPATGRQDEEDEEDEENEEGE